jgi:hypothetical protein
VLDAVGGADRAQQAVLADRVDGVARDGGGVNHPVLRVVAPAQFAGERVLTKRRDRRITPTTRGRRPLWPDRVTP